MAVSLQAQILALRTAVEAALTGGSAEPREAEVPWTAGQRLTGQVEAELPGGRYQIRVGAFQFDVDLPLKAQVGDTLRLEYIARSPRVAFALIPATDAEAEPGAPVSARLPPVQISPAGRVLMEALQTGAAPSRAAATPAQIQDPTPLLATAAASAGALAAALKGTLEGSGLFYESHLAQWFAGERPLASLLREPQARLPAAPQPATPDAEQRPAAAPSDSRPRGLDPRMYGPLPAESRERVASLDAQMLGQIRSQLDVIEQRQVVWQGQAWPGQPLEWRVEDPPERTATADQPLPWTTHLRLTLPRLGAVEAELHLTAGHVRVRLAAGSAAAASDLRRAQPSLSEALALAGLVLTGWSVSTDGAP